MFCRYSDDTIRAVEMLDSDEKIDLDLIVSLIRHIVLNEDVSRRLRGCFRLWFSWESRPVRLGQIDGSAFIYISSLAKTASSEPEQSGKKQQLLFALLTAIRWRSCVCVCVGANF